MVKAFLTGFVAYSGTLLVLVFNAHANQVVGPIVVTVLSAFWLTYAFVAAAMAFYVFDMNVVRFFAPSVRLQQMMNWRVAHQHPVTRH